MWLWQCQVCPFRLWLPASLSKLRAFGLIIFSSLILIPNSWYLASHPTRQSRYNFLYSNVWLPGQQQRKAYMVIPGYLRGIVSRTSELPHLKPTKSELAFWQDYQEIQMNVKIWETALCTTSRPEDVSYLPGIWGTPGILGTAHTPIIHSTSCEWVIFQPNPEHEKKWLGPTFGSAGTTASTCVTLPLPCVLLLLLQMPLCISYQHCIPNYCKT